ncbi:ethanolamine permease [Sinomicrobium oceani]|uniref:Ethanolamine permease n=1 Tax=Sinomicrobium oceani TaxID=1150368 RepID=A0A1K1NF18_9FLAO|nr:ethanolamine permease [Sinomicrobium oceani]SFW33845.1 ethanolamine permease [Sinomicrobium oceani]
MSEVQLNKALTPLMLWGLGVGYVISGMYFGWNLGLEKGGTYGLAIATFFIIIMYCTFTFSYTEMACAIPKAGGAFEYANRGLGRHLGFVAGIAQNIEFVFAPPAIAAAIGAYLNLLYPSVDLLVFAIGAYIIFTGINILGVKFAASFELVITVLAIIELLIFAGVALPEFDITHLQINPMPNGFAGIFAAIPFAIWFFLAIEGVANVAEETINPQRNVLLGFGSAIVTLVLLCVLTFVSAVGVAGWEAIVYPQGSNIASDSPLPLALSRIIAEGHVLYKLLIGIGLLGLVASFHGIILAGGRATFEFGRVGYAPQLLGKVNTKFRTPANALIANMLVGIVALITGKTGDIITIACFGALGLYIVSMISFFALRKKEPEMERPFRVPLYPLFPLTALVIAVIALIAMSYNYPVLALIFFGIVGLSYVYFLVFLNKKMSYSAL